MDYDPLLIAVLLLLGMAGLCVAAYEVIKLRRFLRAGIRARAQRTGFEKGEGGDIYRTVDLPVIRFHDQRGRAVQTMLETNLFNKREQFDIIYDPEQPEKILLDNWTMHMRWMFGVLLVLLSILFAAIALGV